MVSMPIVFSCDKNSDNRNNIKAGLTIKGSDLTEYNMTAAKGEHFLSVTASGDWNISVSSEESDVSWVTVKPESGNGSKSNVILAWEANGSEQSRTAVLTLKASGASATLTLTQAGKSETPEPTPGPNPNPNPNPNPGPSEIKAGWLELPAMPEDSKFGFFSHDMKIGNVKTRNYTYAWDYENLSLRGLPIRSARGQSVRENVLMPGDWILPFLRNTSLCCIVDSEAVTTGGTSCRLRTD